MKNPNYLLRYEAGNGVDTLVPSSDGVLTFTPKDENSQEKHAARSVLRHVVHQPVFVFYSQSMLVLQAGPAKMILARSDLAPVADSI